MKKKCLILIIGIISIHVAFAQADYTIKDSNYTRLRILNVLPDKNFSFEQILKDTTLTFEKKEKIALKGLQYIWLKCTVKNALAYDQKYAVRAIPQFDNLLYYFNEDSAKWLTIRGGEMVANNRTLFKYMPCIFKAGAVTTFYIKMKVTAVNTSSYLLNPQITLENLTDVQTSRNIDFTWWLITIAIALSFVVYNGYLYFMFREKVYLYYLIILFGGIIYSTSFNFFTSYFISFKSLNAVLLSNGSCDYLPFDRILMRAATIIVIAGFVQFTRKYLQTVLKLPFWDKLLKYGLIIYCIFWGLITLLQFLNVIPPDNRYPFYSNILNLILISLMLIVGVIGYRKHIKQAGYFLLAMAIPLLLMLMLVCYLTFYAGEQVPQTLANIAIITVTLTFAIAVVARVNIIKEELTEKKLENQLIAGEIAIKKEQNKQLQQKIAYDKRAVADAEQIKLLMKELHHRVKNNLQIVSSLLSLQSFRIKDKAAADAVREGQHRIEAMSLIHQRLYTHDNITEVNIKEFVTDISESLMQAYGYDKNNFVLNLKIESELMDVDKAIPLSLIINELVTNAFKYAYADTAKPALSITLTKVQNDMQLFIADNGKGLDMEAWETNKGYGKELIQTFTKQLDGEITVTVDNGTTFKINFPATLHYN